MVSCTVATDFSAASGIPVSISGAWVWDGMSSIRALDVFFCLRPHDWEPLLRMAELADDSRVNLQTTMRARETGLYGDMPVG